MDNKEYDSYDESSSACDVTKEGTVTSKTTYKCSLKNTEYDSNQTASNNCYEIRQGTTSNYYTCSSGRLSGTKCVDSYSVSGSVSTSCTCTGGSWKYGTKYPGTYTACRSGYSESTPSCS